MPQSIPRSFAATTDLEGAAGLPPTAWDASLQALRLAALFKMEAYPRACVYGDPANYVTSRAYKKTQTRDNQWVAFQHHTKWCARPLRGKGCASMCRLCAAGPGLCSIFFVVAHRWHVQAYITTPNPEEHTHAVTGCLTACRKSEETSTCAGRVAFFVKAEVRDDNCREALRALGLPTETQRFAIVDAYAATDVQKGTQGATMKQPWVSAVAHALVSARLLMRPTEYPRLLGKVQDMATVLAIGHQSRVTLRRASPAAGTLKQLAIPLSSNFEQWYHLNEGDNLAVHPVCRIDPRKCTTVVGDGTGAVRTAINAVRNTMLYFVHTYSSSNCKIARPRRAE